MHLQTSVFKKKHVYCVWNEVAKIYEMYFYVNP